LEYTEGDFAYTVKKKVREFPVPSRDVTTKLSLGGNNDVITELFLPRESLVSDIPAVDGKLVNLFLRCRLSTIEDLITVKRWPALKQSDPLKLITYLYLDYVKFMNQQIV
jgi:hypothetical protein